MRLRITLLTVVILMGGVIWGCPNKAHKVLRENPTIMTMRPTDGYVKKVAVVQAPLPQADMDRRAGDLLYNTFVTTLKKENQALNLVVSGDEDFPDFMAHLAQSTKAIDAEALSRSGRLNGYHGLITTALHYLRPDTRKSGMLWFRKTRYQLMYELTLDLYDPFTGAKLLSVLRNDVIEIEQNAYEALKASTAVRLEALDNTIVALAQELGALVITAMKAQPWQATIVQVDGTRLELPVGPSSGLRQGQKLMVVKGNRVLQGHQGEKFVLPGAKIGEIVVTAFNDQTTEAETDKAGIIEVGDIALPIK